MSPSATENNSGDKFYQNLEELATLKPVSKSILLDREEYQLKWLKYLPAPARTRFEKAGIDLSKGYPVILDPKSIPRFIHEAYEIRNEVFPYIERAIKADPHKRALLSAAKEVQHLTKHLGTEIIGLQLADLDDNQRDELALLVAERVVVFFRGQDLSPQKQLELGKYWGQIERHPQARYVPLPDQSYDDKLQGSGITVIWRKFLNDLNDRKQDFRKEIKNTVFHTDLVHEKQPAGITHLHNDTIPENGGDTIWSSGYAAYDKLSLAFQTFLDGKTAIYRSAHPYLDRDDPLKGPVYIEREHPIIRTHPATGWKSLFVNRAMTTKIVGLEPTESRIVLEYLFGIFEKNLDIQVRFRWQPSKEGFGTSAIWDNRISQHYAVADYDQDNDDRHGTRVSSLAEVPYFDPSSISQRESLGI